MLTNVFLIIVEDVIVNPVTSVDPVTIPTVQVIKVVTVQVDKILQIIKFTNKRMSKNNFDVFGK